MSKFKPTKIMVLREAINRLAQILASRTIQVVQRGMEARVEYDPATLLPKVVYLPSIPDTASEELCDAIQGFLDHEIGHVLFTDPKVLLQAQKIGASGVHMIVEDVYVESKMIDMMRGTRINLANTGKFYINSFVIPQLKNAGADKARQFSLLMPSVIRALAGQGVFEQFVADLNNDMANELTKRLEPVRNKLQGVTSSEHALEIAKEIMKLLQMPEQQSSQQDDGEEDQDGQAQGDKQEKGKPKKGKSKDKQGEDDEQGDGQEQEQGAGQGNDQESEDQSGQESAGADGDSDGDGEEQQGAGQGSGNDDSEDSQGSNGQQSGSSNESGDGSEESDGPAARADGTDSEELAPPPKGKNKNTPHEGGHNNSSGGPEEAGVGGMTWEEVLDAIQDIEDFDDAASDAIQDNAIASAKNSKYLVFSTDKDKIEPLSVLPSAMPRFISSCENAIEKPVMEMVNPMAKHIERAISARSASILIGGRRSGRLHGAGLHKLVMNDERVFCRREQSKTKDVAVSLVVDASGSMRGPKSLTAAQAAFALSSVLERLRIKNEVICFTTGPQVPSYGEINHAQSKGLVYSRITSIVMPVIKEFSEPLNSLVRARFGAMPDQISMESNIDGESIEYAAKRLVRQAASRHVMIVLSDGQPAGATMSRYGNPFGADLKEKVKMIEQAGVDIVGIGIQSSAVQQFYDKSIVINQISELPGAVMGQLQRLLVPQ